MTQPLRTQLHCPRRRDDRRLRRAGFTLTELLIVMGIITLLAVIAVPTFKALSGGRSVDSASNNVSAILGQARAEAIGLQRTGGVLFYIDQASDRVAAVIVREVVPPPSLTSSPADLLPPGAVCLDMTPDAAFTLLPKGVMLNTFCDVDTTSASPLDSQGLRVGDGYVGFNPVYAESNFTTPIPGTRCGGAILFDGAGRLSVRPYRLSLLVQNPNTTGPRNVASDLAKLLAVQQVQSNPSFAPPTLMGKALTGRRTVGGGDVETVSSVGVVMFDQQDFRDATVVKVTNGSGAQTQYQIQSSPEERDGDGDGSGDVTPSKMTDYEKAEEAWIDQNGTPFLVARHSGALLRNR